MRHLSIAATIFLLTLGGGVSYAAEAKAAEAVATIDGQAITWAELESFAADQLREIDKKRHQILESSLAGLIETRLLDQEAQRQGMTVADLLKQEVESKVEAVTDADVDAWYEENRARMRQPKEAVADQIRSFLAQQRSDPLRRELLSNLRERYSVRMLFEPLRIEIEPGTGAVAGPDNAVVTVTEFSDFQCPACKRIMPDFNRLKEAYGDRVRFDFRQYPLTNIHPQAFKASEAALCAGDQGKFWEMHDALFAKQRQLAVDQLKERAREIGLDGEAFDACLDGDKHRLQVQTDMRSGRKAGVTGTPTLFVNGRPVTLLRGVPPFDTISSIIEDELTRAGKS